MITGDLITDLLSISRRVTALNMELFEVRMAALKNEYKERCHQIATRMSMSEALEDAYKPRRCEFPIPLTRYNAEDAQECGCTIEPSAAPNVIFCLNHSEYQES